MQTFAVDGPTLLQQAMLQETEQLGLVPWNYQPGDERVSVSELLTPVDDLLLPNELRRCLRVAGIDRFIQLVTYDKDTVEQKLLAQSASIERRHVRTWLSLVECLLVERGCTFGMALSWSTIEAFARALAMATPMNLRGAGVVLYRCEGEACRQWHAIEPRDLRARLVLNQPFICQCAPC